MPGDGIGAGDKARDEGSGDGLTTGRAFSMSGVGVPRGAGVVAPGAGIGMVVVRGGTARLNMWANLDVVFEGACACVGG